MESIEELCKKAHLLPRRAKGFKIKAELKLAPGNKGIGVFAAQFIPANTQVDDHHYIYYDEQEALEILASLPSDVERRNWLMRGFGKDGKIAVHDANVDDGGMVNHDDNPTLLEIDGHEYTTRDVNEGEELTEDYDTYEKVDFYEKLCDKYGAVDWFVGNCNNNDQTSALSILGDAGEVSRKILLICS